MSGMSEQDHQCWTGGGNHKELLTKEKHHEHTTKFNLGGGSIGAQIGVEKIDAVMLFMNAAAVGSLLKDKFEIGGELGANAGPVGRNASASTDAMLQAGILSYSRSKGLFVGAVLKGAVISPDNDLNKAVFGMDAKTLLDPGRKPSQVPAVVQAFPETLASFSKK